MVVILSSCCTQIILSDVSKRLVGDGYRDGNRHRTSDNDRKCHCGTPLLPLMILPLDECIDGAGADNEKNVADDDTSGV